MNKMTNLQAMSGARQQPDPDTMSSSLNSAVSAPLWRSFDSYTYAKRSHWTAFEGNDVELFGCSMDPGAEQLKVYQDLLVLTFIKENIPPGSRILDVGGGKSRILNHLARRYECWNIDKLEGVGNGPTEIEDPPYRLVRDYMGNFSSELRNNYFDLVFSISALEHVPQHDSGLFDRIIHDINRVLKPGGLSLHLFDIIIRPNGFWTNKFTQHIFDTVETINKHVLPEVLRQDPDLYVMGETAYDRTWFHTTRKPYAEHGMPSSLNILWRKKDTYRVEGSFSRALGRLDTSAQEESRESFFVVTPTLNVVATIDRTVYSVVTQRGGFPIRYHVQDGGSTDGTIEKLRQWAQLLKGGAYPNVQFSWASGLDGGMYAAIANAFDSLTIDAHDFMAWINGDDVLMPDACASVFAVCAGRSEIQWLGGSVRVIDENDCLLAEHDIAAPTEIIRAGLCDGRHWTHLQQEGMFFKKCLWFRAKHALRDYRLAGDWSLWREFAHHAEYHQLDQPLGAFRKRAGQLSAVRHNEYQAEIEAAIPLAERREVFEKLYARRLDMHCSVVQLDGVRGPIVERRSSAPHFEGMMRRLT